MRGHTLIHTPWAPTCGPWPVCGGGPALLGADPSALQQRLQGAQLPWGRHATQSPSAAPCVDSTRLPWGQGSPSRAPCPMEPPAGGAGPKGPLEGGGSPHPAVGGEQQDGSGAQAGE